MKKKLIGFGIFIVLVGIFVLIDWIISLGYQFEIVSIDPYPGIADGNTQSTIVVRLTRTDGTPVEGHDVRILSLGGGTLPSYRQTTDENGIVTFQYVPYISTSIRPAEDVTMRVRDESSSIFIAIPPSHTFVLELEEPAEGEGGGVTSDSFFG